MEQHLENALWTAMQDVIKATCPQAVLVPKYGGHMIEMSPGDMKSQIGGVFFYAAHASVEFTEGHALSDPQGLLEGKGKLRRHLKLHSLSDVADKDVAGFLTQAAEAWQ